MKREFTPEDIAFDRKVIQYNTDHPESNCRGVREWALARMPAALDRIEQFHSRIVDCWAVFWTDPDWSSGRKTLSSIHWTQEGAIVAAGSRYKLDAPDGNGWKRKYNNVIYDDGYTIIERIQLKP